MELKPQEKIKIAIEIVDVCYVFDSLIKFLTFRKIENWDSFLIMDTGDIYNEDTGKYLNEAELEDFLDYARQLSK